MMTNASFSVPLTLRKGILLLKGYSFCDELEYTAGICSCDRREMKRWYWVEDVGRQEEREREANLG